MSDFQQILIDRLTSLKPSKIDIIDNSEKHKGHAGYKPGGNSHFRLLIVSDIFDGLSKLQRHKLVHNALANELKLQIHALSIKALTNEENDKNSFLM
jgi:BolA family transcriptional regulator, general stress-responsive regulator